MSIIQNPVEQFFDLDGTPLKDGYIYCGQVNSNPETNPVQVYSDEAFTIPLAQPIRTINGYPALNGSPITLYSVSGVSLQVRNSRSLSVFYAANTAIYNLAANVSNRSSNTILTFSDNAKTIVATGTFTQTFDASATLGAGWGVEYVNAGTGVITFDPNLAELIDGLATEQLLAGQSCYIYCDGTGFRTSGMFLNNLNTNPIKARNLDSSSQGISMINGKLVVTAAGSLTIALKTLAGTDPTATDPVLVYFEDNDGSYTPLVITAALSLVVTNGSTLGTTNNTLATLWVVLFNDSGTPRLAVANLAVNTGIGDDVLNSSVAEGGAGGADSAGVFYTGVAVTNKQMKVLAYVEITEATAGNWVTAYTKLRLNQGTNQKNIVSQKFSTPVSTNITGLAVAPIGSAIPNNARRITVSLIAIATNGVSQIILQAGSSAGYGGTTYDSYAVITNAGTAILTSTVGALLRTNNVAATLYEYKIVLDRISPVGAGFSTWQMTAIGRSDTLTSVSTAYANIVIGAGDLDRLQLTTLGGANLFTGLAPTAWMTYEI